MTVSRALRDPSLVADDTHRRIARAMRDIGYVPNALASGLRTAGSKVVASIVPSLRNSLYAETNQGLADEFRAHGIHLMLGDSGASMDETGDLITTFLAHRPCGIVVHDPIRSTHARVLLRKAGIPVAEVGDLNRRPLYAAVSYCNRDAAAAMTEHLIARGYRRIGFASLSPAVTERAAARLTGFRAALRKAGRAAPPELVVFTERGFAAGAVALERLVAAGADAIFFAGDVLAIGAMLECQRRGWKIPERIAIASFDDHEIAARMSPQLTTLRLPRYEIGRRAARFIVERNGGALQPTPLVVDLGFEVVAREST